MARIRQVVRQAALAASHLQGPKKTVITQLDHLLSLVAKVNHTRAWDSRTVSGLFTKAGAKGGVADDAVERPDAIAPADLLALGVVATVVGDAHLVDPPAGPGHFGGDLGLEAKAVLLELDRLDDLATEGLVAGLHVGEVQVGEHVRRQREEAVADRMPEIQHSMGAAADET